VPEVFPSSVTVLVVLGLSLVAVALFFYFAGRS
jgi:hypothetical protein